MCILVTLKFDTNDVYVTDELGQEYKALQLHFHWRKDEKSSGGSEHTINGKHYPVEVYKLSRLLILLKFNKF